MVCDFVQVTFTFVLQFWISPRFGWLDLDLFYTHLDGFTFVWFVALVWFHHIHRLPRSAFTPLVTRLRLGLRSFPAFRSSFVYVPGDLRSWNNSRFLVCLLFSWFSVGWFSFVTFGLRLVTPFARVPRYILIFPTNPIHSFPSRWLLLLMMMICYSWYWYYCVDIIHWPFIDIVIVWWYYWQLCGSVLIDSNQFIIIVILLCVIDIVIVIVLCIVIDGYYWYWWYLLFPLLTLPVCWPNICYVCSAFLEFHRYVSQISHSLHVRSAWSFVWIY